MGRAQIALTTEEILDGIRDMSESQQRKLAGTVAHDRKLEPFVEELEDILASERAAEEGPVEPLIPEEFQTQ